MSTMAYCSKEQRPCVRWAERYFKDCLCNVRDDFSFGFGLISLVCWGVAEIPQIITNFHTKSSHGVSLAFLLTWVLGDVFNLVGCLLEPATLPTQFYTAVLYTTSTVVLVVQGLYYDHVYKWLKRQKKNDHKVEEEKQPFRPKPDDSGIPIPDAVPRQTPRREYYFTSARSLAGSGTPPFRSYLRVAKSGPSTMELDNGSSSDDETTTIVTRHVTQPKPFRSYLRVAKSGPSATELDNGSSSDDETTTIVTGHVTPPRPIPRSAGYGTFLAASLNLPSQTNALTGSVAIFASRRILQEGGGSEGSVFGEWLGWLMAAIYMGGRIPQIWLNIKRGSVEGLNPLMFIFALVANLTYVLSIVVRTTEWERLKPNMPWLLDAAVCVFLDLFIILQYIYYRCFRNKSSGNGEDHYGDYTKARKPDPS